MRLLFFLALLAPTLVQAQGIELDPFRPAIDSRGFVTVNGAGVLGHGQLSFGLVTTWGTGALREGDVRVDDIITPTLQAAIGLFGRLELGGSLPFRIVSGPDELSSQGVGNAGLHVKLRLFGGLAVLGSVHFAGSGAWLGDDQTTFSPALLAEHRVGRLRLGANLAWRPRATRTFMSLTSASELPAGVAAAYAVVRDRIDLVGEVYGAIPLAGQDHHPVEATLGVKVYLARSSHFVVGAGSSLLSPSARAYVGIVFEPRLGGRGGGELAEVVEEPPAPPVVAEEEEVAVADGHDWPPLEDLEEQCQDCEPPKKVIRTHSEMVIHETIGFRTGSAEILPESFAILDAVAASLVANPDIVLLEVAGHADERGSDEDNLRLTQARAEAVRLYLIAHGAAAERLVARGYGETVPLDRRHHEAAWAKNRRVQFIILRQGVR